MSAAATSRCWLRSDLGQVLLENGTIKLWELLPVAVADGVPQGLDEEPVPESPLWMRRDSFESDEQFTDGAVQTDDRAEFVGAFVALCHRFEQLPPMATIALFIVRFHFADRPHVVLGYKTPVGRLDSHIERQYSPY